MKVDAAKKLPPCENGSSDIMTPCKDDNPLPGRKPSDALFAGLRAVAEMERKKL